MEILPPPPGYPPPPPCPEPPPPPEQAKGKRGRGRPKEAGGYRGPRAGARFANGLGRLFAGDADRIGMAVITAATKGDMSAAKLVLDRIWPARRGRPVHLPDFPELHDIRDIPAATLYLVKKVADGTLTSAEAADISTILSGYCAQVETVELQARVDALERATPACR